MNKENSIKVSTKDELDQQNYLNKMDNNIAALILTKDEELHLERCLKSIKGLVSDIYVIDSGSKDKTADICKNNNAKFFFNKFISHSKQFNFGLNLLRGDNFKWILKIDADEIFTPNLIKEITHEINKENHDYSGFAIKRKIIFQGKVLNYGGVTTTQLRIFKANDGYCEDVFMDEHIKVRGKVKYLKEPFFDYCLKNITWWTQKHNFYSSREVYSMFSNTSTIYELNKSKLTYKNKLTRFLKQNLYLKSPILLRAFLLFLFKYFFLLGFLDGIQGLIYNFLQSFWYRFLVDVKILELRSFSKKNNLSLKESIKKLL